MIRFVDIRNQGIGARFAFWCTGVSKFLEFDGEQAWDNWKEFEETYNSSGPQLEGTLGRLKALCPEWVFDDGEDDIEGWYEGKYDQG